MLFLSSPLQLMSYTGGTQYVHADRALAKVLRFAAADPSRGDASLTIAALSPAHGATYQCKVKKNPGVDARKLSLVVMGKQHGGGAGIGVSRRGF